MKNAETIQSYFTRVSQIKEQLEAVEEEEEDIVITILNSLPGSWDSFIQGMCARRKWLTWVDSGKSAHKKNLVKDKNIIADSIMDHLIPQVYSLKTQKEMFDSLTKLFEGKNINQNMTLKTSWRKWRSRMQRPYSHTLQGSLKSKNNLKR